MSIARRISVAVAAVSMLLLGGCAIRPITEPANDRAFDFKRDAFAYANQLEWDYRTDFATGTTSVSSTSKAVPATYSRHCIVMARTARQFFQFARFEPKRPQVSEETYRALIHGVISHSPSEPIPESGRVTIPGYADLRSFSKAHEQLLKDEIGSWAGSYFQLGNWRMIFPFTRHHQAQTAHALLEEVASHRPPVVHLIKFPQITINHGVLIYGAHDEGGRIKFDVYDPNDPDEPAQLTFDKTASSFHFGPNRYFGGGPLNVYEIYRDGVY